MLSKFKISYSVYCNTGKIRSANQDNFWCSGIYLDVENDGLSHPVSGTVSVSAAPVFAVFDGMGGEQKGEQAAFIAAKTFDQCIKKRRKTEPAIFFSHTCSQINQKICEYQQAHHIGTMGTTGAMLMFTKSAVHLCNVGDSRVYHLGKNGLQQLSLDHVQEHVEYLKPPLTQYLGVNEEEFVIEPYIAHGELADGDQFLICSDGLTDMVSEEEIATILAAQEKTPAARRLVQVALNNGGHDNVTVIVCKICKKTLF